MSKNSSTGVDLFAEDAVFESPYTARTPGRFEGKAVIYNFIKNAQAQMQGKIIHYREYSNPMLVIEAWGSTQNLRQSLNADNAA